VEFKRDVVTVARRRVLTLAEVTADFNVSPEPVRRGLRQADIDDGVADGVTSSEPAEIVQLRRDKPRLEMENEIFRGPPRTSLRMPSQNDIPVGPGLGD